MTNKQDVKNEFNWAIFYEWMDHSGNFAVQLVFQGRQKDKFWLGGSKVGCLLFRTRAEAEEVVKMVRKDSFFKKNKGRVRVHRFEIKPRYQYD